MRWTVLLGVSLAIGCGGGNGYAPQIDPTRFTSVVDNRYFPLVPGTVFEYDVLETTEHVVVTVTHKTRDVLGVTCTEVHDVASVDNVVAEDTLDWYAQDDEGNVWYFGEDTTAFSGGMTSKEGSWESGVDGALPGRIIVGAPRVGDSYRQEFYRGHAEDMGEIVSLDAAITVAFGSFTGCMETRDFSALDPEAEEHKWYCLDVGQVSARKTKGGAETEDLVKVTRP